MFDDNDYQLLRTAALDIYGNEQNLVRVAGVVKRIKNWWRAKFNPEFAQQQEELEGIYNDLESPLGELISTLQELDKAFKSQDPDTVARLSGQMSTTITKVTNKMEKFRHKVREVDALVPVSYVDENGHKLSERDLEWTTKGYDQNKDLMTALWERLPEEFKSQVPIRQNVEIPITSISWFRKYSPGNIRVSSTVRNILAVNLAKMFSKYFTPEQSKNFVTEGIDEFIENLKRSILEDSVFIYADFPDVSKQVAHRPSNEMMIRVYCPGVSYKINNQYINISIGKIELTDISVSVTGDRRSNDLRLSKIDMIEPTEESSFQLLDLASSLNAPQVIDIPDDQESTPTEDKGEVEDIGIFAAGPLSKIIRTAVLSQSLPKTQAVVNVNGQTFHHKVRFAKVLSSALRQEIDAESSVRCDGEEVQLQVSVVGTKMASIPAIQGISEYLADKFVRSFGVGVDVEVTPGKSTLVLAGSKILDDSFRKVAFDRLQMGNK